MFDTPDIPQHLIDENLALSHAIQTGVKYEQELLGSDDGTPKHLRTGVNIAMCECSALVQLLVNKGICTTEEAFTAINGMLHEEVNKYEARLTEGLGKKVKLV